MKNLSNWLQTSPFCRIIFIKEMKREFLFFSVFFTTLTFLITGCSSTRTPSVSSYASLPDNYLPTRTPISPAPMMDITYCSTGGLQQKLDFYPAKNEQTNPAPLVIYIHGGAWLEGDKEIASYLSTFSLLDEAGFAVSAVNYRLAPDHPFPAQIIDILCAVRFLRANSAQLKIDPERFGLMGDSAGGHLAALAGLADAKEDWITSEYPDINMDIQAVVDLYGPADLTRNFVNSELDLSKLVFQAKDRSDPILSIASPITYAHSDSPPILIIHGEDDQLVPVEQSILLNETLKGVGAPVRFISVKNAGHGFSQTGNAPVEPGWEEIDNAVVNFFVETLK